MLVNTPHGGAANPQGFYSITVPTGSVSDNSAVMRASFIGYRSTADTIIFSGQKDITTDFVLDQDVLGLEAVIVTGLGGLEEKKKLGVLVFLEIALEHTWFIASNGCKLGTTYF